MAIARTRWRLGWSRCGEIVLHFSRMLRALLVAAALALAVALAVLAIAPPSPVPASAAPTAFSAERAMRSLKVIAARPHPTGTDAAGEVRDYIVSELTALGFSVDVQDATALTEVYSKKRGGPVVAAHVRNVLARWRGTTPGPALLLMAHYDSRELAPGASDDGYGTATLLETARVLAASPSMRHDVLLLFTEGEEQGLLGAKAFLDENPAAREVALVLNFEARGDRGSVLMFQTSEHAGALIDALASAAPDVAATSVSQEVYRRMPNDTDLTLWLGAGYPAMNFANVDGFGRYHQPTDTVENADAATLQHDGSYALSLARAFADRDVVAPPPSADQVYFRVGPLFVHYAARMASALAGLALGLLGVAVAVGFRRKRLRLRDVAAGAGVTLLALIAATAMAIGAWWVVDHASGGALATQHVREPLRKAVVAALVLLGGGAAWGVYAMARRRVRTHPLAVGAMVWWAALAIATAVMLPGGSYLFVWPLIAAGAAWCVDVVIPPRDRSHPAVIALHIVAATSAVVLLVPVALQLGVAFGPPAAPALAALGALVATAVVPTMDPLGGARRWMGPTLLVGVSAVVMVVCFVVPPYDASAPRPDSLLYVVDTDAGTASWVSFDDATDAWTSRVMTSAQRATTPALLPRSKREVLQSPAARVWIDPTRIAVATDAQNAATRSLRLRITFPAGTEAVDLQVPPEAHVTKAAVQGKPFGVVTSDGWLDLAFFGPPASGLDLDLEMQGTSSVHLHVVAQTRGLPAELAAPLGARPSSLMAEVVQRAPLFASDMTLVTTSFDL